MILTITLNPSVDMSYFLKKLEIDTINRASHVLKTAGGKGINVTRVVHLAGHPVRATGFLGGTNGTFILQQLHELQVSTDFVLIRENTRNCIAILHERKQTEILEGGPEIYEDEAKQFIEKFERLIEQTDVITASGSLPNGLPPSFYQTLISIANAKRKKFILDTSGQALRESLSARPFLIKPNLEELEQFINKKVKTIDEVKQAILSLHQEVQIPIIVVSLGADGAVAFANGRFYKGTPPNVEVKNTVGCGDAMVAGFAIAIDLGLSVEEILAYGCAFGALNAMDERTGYIDRNSIDVCLLKTVIERI